MLFVAPAGREPGVSHACLGLVRALDREGIPVAFAKPIADPTEDRSEALMRLGAHLDPPTPMARSVAKELLAAGAEDTLMERMVALCTQAGSGADVLVVQGMTPEPGMLFSTRVNGLMFKNLDADLVVVAKPRGETPAELANTVAIAVKSYMEDIEGRAVGCILNRVTAGAEPADDGQRMHLDLEAHEPPLSDVEVAAYRDALLAEKIRPLAIVPYRGDLEARRVKDLAQALHARVLRPGDYERRRIRHYAVCAMNVSNAARTFVPGTLIITPGDRGDILVAVALAVVGGLSLAGVLLTGGLEPDPRVLALCGGAFKAGLPLLAVEDDSYPAASKVAALDALIPMDDGERVDRVMTAVADCIDRDWVKSLVRTNRPPRMSPPAFRHRLVEAARAANKRIVLPEGAEPRTIAAVSIAAERGIARCVLLGDPVEIREMAKKQGVALHPSIEIVDAAAVASRYVEPLVERRKAKGMTRADAAQELSDTIMIGTMMMALGEADGLVSGAVHTTAHTIKPALQIIRTAPGCDLVSSVFFMCLPEQVLVFGDCAVNPHPTAPQLADIAIQSAESAAAFGIEPRVAMLSYSTGTSGGGEDVDKVRQATELARSKRPDLAIDGPLQYDAAIAPDVGRQKAPNSRVAGHATVFVFPDLDAGNVTYKAVQRSAHVVSIGPMLQGLAKPVNDLSRGCFVEDIVFTIALTAVQAQQAAARR